MNSTPGLAAKFKGTGKQWPTIPRGNVNEVRKILQPNHVPGLPPHWPKIYYVQRRSNLAENRTKRNVNVSSLGDGSYLYLVEYNPKTTKYHTVFVKVLNKLETGSRHFQLPSRNRDRVILAAGELEKKGTKIRFNLESGTYTKNLMKITGRSERNYIGLVKNALKGEAKYTSDILVPQIPGSPKNLLGKCTFNFGPTRTKKVQNQLTACGINSVNDLIRKLM